ncbi:MAG: transposase [Thermodesulfobacteriota bacterium]|nr:transposase [Thermodesulfobacteriota bacterium]
MDQQKRKTIRHFNDPGHAHFLTFSCYRQLPLLSRERTRRWLIQAIANAMQRHETALLSYVIMPEHVHLIVFPLLPAYDISILLKTIKQSVARKAKHFLRDHNQAWLEKLMVQRGSRKVFRFWQTGPGYDRNLHTKDELFEKIRYIHNNPVRRGLVSTPEEWKWSSASWYKGERNVELVIDDFIFS